PLMHMVGVLGLNLGDDRQSRAAIDQRDDAASTGRSEHGVAFKVAEPQPLFDDFGTVVNPRGRTAILSVFAAAGAFAGTAEEGFPVVAVLVLFDPGVDR